MLSKSILIICLLSVCTSSKVFAQDYYFEPKCKYPISGDYTCKWSKTDNLREVGSILNSEKDGEIKYYNADGTLEKVEFYVEGQLEGKVNEWKNGVLSSEEIWRNGVKISAKTYHENGTLKSIGEATLDGKPKGTHYEFYDDGSIFSKRDFNDGVFIILEEYSRTGELISSLKPKDEFAFQYTSYHNDGSISATGEKGYDGNEKGEWKYYHETGYLNEAVQFIEPFELSEIYYPDGSLKAEGQYVDGVRDGTWISYYQSGKVFERIVFDHRLGANIPVGNFLQYYESGAEFAVFQYDQNGNRHGEQYQYFENGQVFEFANYQAGRLINAEQFDSNGTKLDNGNFKDGNGLLKVYTMEGQLFRILTIEEGIVMNIEE